MKKTPEEIWATTIRRSDIAGPPYKDTLDAASGIVNLTLQAMREFADQETAELREENERLKKEIEQLKIPKMNQGGWLV